jgi:ATP-dependent Clp protease adaptor protein ClpS
MACDQFRSLVIKRGQAAGWREAKLARFRPAVHRVPPHIRERVRLSQGLGPVDRIFCMPIQPKTPAPQTGEPTPPADGQGAVVAERQEQRVQPPTLYKVVMLNDDYTPMEFVIRVLQQFFKHDMESATLIMLKIHHEGRGVCGVYTKDVAATKVELVLSAARRDQHPLQCIMEAA